ncbi:Brp/Blh family beta-carotene 15,15'-dioxygenase [Hymenobacter siberiensis]|jgi:Brp/Blh family beta-carotene 15,15'-monooxygenase|uniref:Brp/Blh family beta-carotene 15,15'-dioxygenase n=1 Tax=Hymenobacter siberiensis TaxID=2848396 RepID=UPI001C1E1EF0|nr:Brp/Blh family beta-carotene 15,15'-dioxygenase [Hymenobacter siberiensis]MBU6120149.1 Brp/Blh family beta-carotene 15,15'-dioxygenase [Hymenobacter siberiensis]
MTNSLGTLASDWSQRRYSYAAVLVLVGLGAAFPGRAGLLLGLPLAVGMVVLGVAHGACDQFVVPASHPGSTADGWRYWLRFLAGYLGLAAAVGLLWWHWPAATVAGFLLLTVWHWGSADAPAGPLVSAGWWLAHSLLRGLLLFAVPAWQWPAETAGIVNGLLRFVGTGTMGPGTFAAGATGLAVVVAVGHVVLWARYAARQQWPLLVAELGEVLILAVLFVALPPKLSVGVYFVFWHSLQHVLRLTGWLGYAGPGQLPGTSRGNLLARLAFFLRRAAPLLLISCVALLVLGRLLAAHLPDETAWFSLALVVASIVTLPHALLVTVVMDAPQWRPAAR